MVNRTYFTFRTIARVSPGSSEHSVWWYMWLVPHEGSWKGVKWNLDASWSFLYRRIWGNRKHQGLYQDFLPAARVDGGPFTEAGFGLPTGLPRSVLQLLLGDVEAWEASAEIRKTKPHRMSREKSGLGRKPKNTAFRGPAADTVPVKWDEKGARGVKEAKQGSLKRWEHTRYVSSSILLGERCRLRSFPVIGLHW